MAAAEGTIFFEVLQTGEQQRACALRLGSIDLALTVSVERPLR
jgi:hypothetical protein